MRGKGKLVLYERLILLVLCYPLRRPTRRRRGKKKSCIKTPLESSSSSSSSDSKSESAIGIIIVVLILSPSFQVEAEGTVAKRKTRGNKKPIERNGYVMLLMLKILLMSKYRFSMVSTFAYSFFAFAMGI